MKLLFLFADNKLSLSIPKNEINIDKFLDSLNRYVSFTLTRHVYLINRLDKHNLITIRQADVMTLTELHVVYRCIIYAMEDAMGAGAKTNDKLLSVFNIVHQLEDRLNENNDKNGYVPKSFGLPSRTFVQIKEDRYLTHTEVDFTHRVVDLCDHLDLEFVEFYNNGSGEVYVYKATENLSFDGLTPLGFKSIVDNIDHYRQPSKELKFD